MEEILNKHCTHTYTPHHPSRAPARPSHVGTQTLKYVLRIHAFSPHGCRKDSCTLHDSEMHQVRKNSRNSEIPDHILDFGVLRLRSSRSTRFKGLEFQGKIWNERKKSRFYLEPYYFSNFLSYLGPDCVISSSSVTLCFVSRALTSSQARHCIQLLLSHAH